MQSDKPALTLTELIERSKRYGKTIDEVQQAHRDGISLEPEDRPETTVESAPADIPEENALDRWIRTSFLHQFHKPREDRPETREDSPESPADIPEENALDRWLRREKERGRLSDDNYTRIMSTSPDIELSGSGEDTVTIFITMHGSMNTNAIPENPTNTVLGGSVGLCERGIKNSLAQIDELRSLYSKMPISDANLVYSYSKYVNVDKPYYDKYKDILENYTYGEPVEDLKKQYEITRTKENHRRVYNTDRTYSIEFDEVARTMGIFIIESKNPILQSFLSSISTLPPLPSLYSRNSATSTNATVREQGEIFDTIQKQNIMNIAVSQPFGGLHDDSGLELPINDNYTTIPHYDNITLSSLLRFFGNLGIRHVNIIESSCRVLDIPLPHTLRRQLSEVELENGKKALQQLKAQGSGGSLRKRTVNMRTLKRHRLKRTVKKRRRPPHKVSTKKR